MSDLRYVAVETLSLLLSSAGYKLAMLSMRKDGRAQVLLWLGITFLLGMSFVLMEIHEFRGLGWKVTARTGAVSSPRTIRS